MGALPRQSVLTPEQVAYMEQQLSDHYGCRVAPVSAYCRAFEQWAAALGEKVKRMDAGEEHEDAGLREAHTAINSFGLQVAIMKSSMLARLVYGGEELRTERCPEHKGQWSGIGQCDHGCDQTGWLRAL